MISMIYTDLVTDKYFQRILESQAGQIGFWKSWLGEEAGYEYRHGGFIGGGDQIDTRFLL